MAIYPLRVTQTNITSTTCFTKFGSIYTGISCAELASGEGRDKLACCEKMNEAMELLAPAGDEAALRAAVCAGADAVYLGFSSFGARASAANFDAESLERAVAYAHMHHVRVHVTVNTLVKDKELEAVHQAITTIAACKADAVIVQDLGVAQLVREHFPRLTLHASTQMALHTAAGARFAARHGFDRVVLARECSLDAIKAVAATGVQTEVFAHGALCASVSGQCLMSSMAGGRSGNRGRCAQPCRQNVTLGDKSAALISLKDLCLRDYLPELQAAGVCSLKIEGRLKRPEYVAVVTSSYRKALDALANGNFAPADAQEKRSLLQVFHRGGFTKGHAMGAEDADLCAIERVGHGGVPMGHITSLRGNLAVAHLENTLNDGDSLRIDGLQDVELRYSGHKETRQATLRLRPDAHVRVGDSLVRLADSAQLAWAQNLQEQAIPITMQIEVHAGLPICMQVSDGASVVKVQGAMAQTAINRALSAADIERAVSKLGDTAFVLQNTPGISTLDAFVPVSELNALRRDALQQLSDKRCAAFFQRGIEAHATIRSQFPLEPDDTQSSQPNNQFVGEGELAVSFPDAGSAGALLIAGATRLIYTPCDLTAAVLEQELCKLPEGAWLALPPQMSDEAYHAIEPILHQNAAKLAGVVVGSVGQLGFPIPLPVALGDGVPLTNRLAVREMATKHVAFWTLWPELSDDELDVVAKQGAPCLLRMYGRERVMLLNHCPHRVALGLAFGRKNCALCKPGDRACASAQAEVKDRKGYKFPLRKVRMPEGCVIEVFNALPTDLSKQEKRRKSLNAGMLLTFAIEADEQQIEITRSFATLMKGSKMPMLQEQATSGHFLRGVE